MNSIGLSTYKLDEADGVFTYKNENTTLGFVRFNEKAEVEYPNHISKLSTAKRKTFPVPRPHQSEAIEALAVGFKIMIEVNLLWPVAQVKHTYHFG